MRKAYVWGHMLISQRQLVAGNYVTHYYGQDGSENVRQLFDNTGAVTDTFDYDAFGILIGRTGTTANSYLYRSQQFDADLGFYYNRARYYDQTRGRFLSRDVFDGVINAPQSLHKYSYADVNPVNSSDSSGYLSTAETGIGHGKLTIPTAVELGGGALAPAGKVALTRQLARKYLPIAINCTLNILAGYYGLPTKAIILGLKLKSISYSEQCEAVGSFVSEAEGIVDELTDEEGEDDPDESDEDKLKYVTYLKNNSTTGETYVGRSRGTGSPYDVVRRRDYSHHKTAQGFGPAVLDKFAVSTLSVTQRWDDPAYQAIRGREQQVIDFYGGSWSDKGRGNTMSGNDDRGVDKRSTLGRIYHQSANAYFGEIHQYTGF